MCDIEQSFATAYSSEENGIVERANQEVLRHRRALLFDSRLHNKWSFEPLPLVQRIMNTVEKSSTGVTPAELILIHSIRLSSQLSFVDGLIVLLVKLNGIIIINLCIV